PEPDLQIEPGGPDPQERRQIFAEIAMTVNNLFAKTAAFFKSDEPSRFQMKKDQKAEADANEREVYRTVNRRDGYHCRCCGA
ncbi:hypothetical protein NL351_29910, partial [Klebsiella pneumoniae]|nr:hypothetical protein [Klebsiella pneumoniae]